MANEQPVIMNIPNEVLQGAVQAAFVKALPPDVQVRMVESLVQQVLTQKVRGSDYRDRTVVEHVIAQVMQEEALKAFRSWMDEQRPVIAKKLQQEIAKRGYADRIMTGVLDSLTKVHISISVKGEA